MYVNPKCKKIARKTKEQVLKRESIKRNKILIVYLEVGSFYDHSMFHIINLQMSAIRLVKGKGGPVTIIYLLFIFRIDSGK